MSIATVQNFINLTNATSSTEVPRSTAVIEETKAEDEFGEVERSPSLRKHDKNRALAVIRDLSGALIEEISPPYLQQIQFVKFSRSGKFVVLASESGQYFYVYKLFPATSFRHNRAEIL